MRAFAIALAACLCPFLARADIPFEKYVLPNGMKVILYPDHTLPLSTVNIWYGVGSQDEPPGRSGFAHLFEHLMFMGTRRVPGNQFDVLMETGGGANNAGTDLFVTDYYSWGPAKLLPTLLWLDADRLEDMGLEMDQDKLNKQREVVRNELRQIIENRPYAKANEAVYKLLYPPTHPYYNGVIGTHADLEAATVTDVKDFFANFYVPNNASLVVAGDFDPARIKPLVDQLFGSIPAGQPVVRKYVRPTQPIALKLSGVKRFTAIDIVELPKVQFTYHSPIAYGPGDAEAELAAAVLGSGKSSRLYKRLVIEEKLASQVSAAQRGYPLDGLFQIDVLARPQADLGRVEKIMDEEIGKFLRSGPTTDELARNVSEHELLALEAQQSLQAKADLMNRYEYFWGTPDGFKRDLDRFRAATPAAVKEWAGRILTPNARVIVHVLPQKPPRSASARDTRPADAPAGHFSVPQAQTFELGNQLKVMVLPRAGLPLVALQLVRSPPGALDVPGKQGLSALAVRMMGEGAADMDALAFADAVQSIGASTAFDADHDQVSVSMTVVKRNLDKGAALFADAVRRPRFDDKEWTRVKSIALDQLRQRADSPMEVAKVVAARLLYGDANPYGSAVAGSEKAVGALTLEDIRQAYVRLMRPQGSVLLIGGDITVEEARNLAGRMFGNWNPASAPPAVQKPDYSVPRHDGMRVVLVDRPGATQTMVQFIAPGVKFADPSRVERQLLNTLLGGSFTSRLNQNLREDKGYTYGAHSTFGLNAAAGDFSANASVQAQSTGASLKEFFKEFDRIRSGDVSEDEVIKSRETVRDSVVRDFESIDGMLEVAAKRLANGLPLDSVTDDLSALEQIHAQSLNRLARQAFPLEQGVLVLVGDKSAILEQLKGLNLPAPEQLNTGGDKTELR